MATKAPKGTTPSGKTATVPVKRPANPITVKKTTRPVPGAVLRPNQAFKGLQTEDADQAPVATDPEDDSAFQRLSLRHQRFVLEYVIYLNATKAYMRAFPGTGAATAGVNGHKLLRNARIFFAVKEVQANVLGHLGITAARILREVGCGSFLDIRRAFNEDGTLLPVHEMPDDVAAAIASIEVFEEFSGSGKERVLIGRTKKVKFVDKKGCLELLMRHSSLLNDKLKVQHDAADPLKALLAELGGSALPVVPADPDHASTAPGAFQAAKGRWRAAR